MSIFLFFIFKKGEFRTWLKRGKKNKGVNRVTRVKIIIYKFV